jgi:uncharacterized protein with HEPN domain
MRREIEKYLWDVLEAIEHIRSFHGGLSFAEYQTNRLVQAATEREFEIIGEALRQMETNFPGSTAGLPDVPMAVGMRNRLAHGYFTVDQETLWNAVMDDLPRLEAAVRARVGEIPDEPPL